MVDGGGSRKRSRAKRAGLIAGALAAGIGAGIAAERLLVGRERLRPDPDATEPFGSARGRSIGPIASFDGTLLHAEEAGEGPTIVFVHGFSLATTSWHYQIDDLSSDHRVVVYDHRGHGRSGRPPSGDWTLRALASDLDAVLSEACADGPAVVVAHSMGGMAALELARTHPGAYGTRIAGLVLVDTTSADVMEGIPGLRRMRAASQGAQEALMRLLAGNAERVDGLRRRASDVSFLGTRYFGFGPRPSPAKVAFVERLLSETPSDVWASLLPVFTGLDVTEVLSAIDVPTLVVVGSHDRLTPPGAAERIARAIPGAQMAVIHGAGHMSMLEKPHAFNARLRAFLARVPSFGSVGA